MIPIDRNKVEPPSVLESADVWGRELCEARRVWHLRNPVGTKPATEDPKPGALSSRYRHAEVKTALEALIGLKCHYCEQTIERFDVEHFRPQSIYPALAYQWSNLLLACQTCNQTYKSDRFPISPDSTQATEDPVDPTSRDGSDEALVLNPCRDDPAEHLDFVDGRIVAREDSLRGRETIGVCGLDRDRLTELRREHARIVESIIASLRYAIRVQDRREMNRLSRDILVMAEDTKPFAGMVRAELARAGYSPQP